MPSSQQILHGLAAVANGWRTLAIVWHFVLAAGLAGVSLGWRPSKRLAGALLALPLASVSVLGWLTGNRFNGGCLAAMAVALVAQALRLPRSSVTFGAPWLVVSGGILVAFGWVYPHFLDVDSWTTYLYAAPMGVIPCSTLAVVVGVASIFDGLSSRAWTLILTCGGAFYGIVGWFRLGVAIDGLLLVGTIALAGAVVFRFGRQSYESWEER
jgi:hypothetical protein